MEQVNSQAHQDASVQRGAGHGEATNAKGRYKVICVDKDGRIRWEDDIENVVTTAGKNVALDAFLAGAPYTVTGPFIGLISSVSFTTGPVAADTMAAHGGWTEAGGTNAPTYSGGRKTAVWNAASGGSKALSAPLSFALTGAGTVKGCFMVLGSGALATVDNTAGTLFSAGLFSGGDKVVSSGDTINVSYTLSL
jgi:hypothetical protein